MGIAAQLSLTTARLGPPQLQYVRDLRGTPLYMDFRGGRKLVVRVVSIRNVLVYMIQIWWV
jgi:hypothetical protein